MRKIFSILIVVILLGFMSYKFLFKKDDEKFLTQGIEYYQQKKYKEAIFYFEKAQEFDNAEASKYLGSIYLETGFPKKAISPFTKYIGIVGYDNDDVKFVLNDLGVAYFKIKDMNNAKKYWQKASELGNTTSLDNLNELEKKK